MKLATYKDGSRDGQLLVVSRDLATAHFAAGMATRLQQVLDDWNYLSPLLQDLSVTLNHGKARHAFSFDPRLCMAPLPRAGQWVTVETDGLPLGALRMMQGASDDFLGACDDAWFGAESWGISPGAGVAAITGDVAMGASPEQGLDGVRLLMLTNDWRLQHLAADERAGLCGLVQSRPAAAFSPVAVTPDELGPIWQRGRVQAPLLTRLNGQRLADATRSGDQQPHLGEAIAHLTKSRRLRAGAIVGLGATAGRVTQEAVGLKFGDEWQVDLLAHDGGSLFGAINQRVIGPGMAGP